MVAQEAPHVSSRKPAPPPAPVGRGRALRTELRDGLECLFADGARAAEAARGARRAPYRPTSRSAAATTSSRLGRTWRAAGPRGIGQSAPVTRAVRTPAVGRS